MDFLEKVNKAFGGWYESLFGSEFSDLRPKDVLRQIIAAMEDSRKEGLDNRVYVPNKYTLEIAFESDEEKEYLLAFLDRAELEMAVRKYMNQNKYYIRGPLDFVIEERPETELDEKPSKLVVKCRWDITAAPRAGEASAAGYVIPGLAEEPSEAEEDPDLATVADDDFTVAETNLYDASTVAPASVTLKDPGAGSKQFMLTKPVTVLGRSSRLGNDIVLERDGMVSKRHAKITMGREGYTISDMNSTNGLWVNDEKIESAVLQDGDIVRLGASEMVFSGGTGRTPTPTPSRPAERPHLSGDFGHGGGAEEFPLASEVLIGRALSCDVRFDDPTVSRRHARIHREGDAFFIEDLGSDSGTEVNEMRLAPNAPMRLRDGDVVRIGKVELRFEVG